jgi:hypothetical protein
MSELADLFDSADISSSVEPNAHTFWRLRLACRSVTFVYFVLWVLVLATQSRSTPPSVPACPDSWCILYDTAGTVEFLWTGLVETATIAELLLTLPSSDRGVPALRHYLAYELLFLLGTAILYWRMPPQRHLVPLYVGVHLIKGFGGGYVLFVARRRLRQHLFSQGGLRAVYEQTLKYMAELLKVFGTQIALCVALAAAFIIERSRPNYGRLLAASTLSIALTQSFVLTVFVRDAGTLRADRIATLDFSLVEALTLVGIVAFSTIGLYAYFLALEDGGKEAVTEELTFGPGIWVSGRMLYFGAHAVYFSAAACVGWLMHQAERAAQVDVDQEAPPEAAPCVAPAAKIGATSDKADQSYTQA